MASAGVTTPRARAVPPAPAASTEPEAAPAQTASAPSTEPARRRRKKGLKRPAGSRWLNYLLGLGCLASLTPLWWEYRHGKQDTLPQPDKHDPWVRVIVSPRHPNRHRDRHRSPRCLRNRPWRARLVRRP